MPQPCAHDTRNQQPGQHVPDYFRIQLASFGFNYCQKSRQHRAKHDDHAVIMYL